MPKSTSTEHYSNYLQFSEELIETNLGQESAFTSTILQSRLHCLFVINLIYFIGDEFTDFDLDLEIEALSSGSSDESASEVENTDCSALGTWTDTATENADNCSLGSVLCAIDSDESESDIVDDAVVDECLPLIHTASNNDWDIFDIDIGKLITCMTTSCM